MCGEAWPATVCKEVLFPRPCFLLGCWHPMGALFWLLKLMDKKNQGYQISDGTLRLYVDCWKTWHIFLAASPLQNEKHSSTNQHKSLPLLMCALCPRNSSTQCVIYDFCGILFLVNIIILHKIIIYVHSKNNNFTIHTFNCIKCRVDLDLCHSNSDQNLLSRREKWELF